jgi:3-isopropylmalate/(R)-2-methylmalate dehydratase small subunit
MKAVRAVTGRAVPLDRSDVDTDQIIPASWLKRVERTGFGKGLFAAWRDDRGFVLNDERFTGARILLAGPNFGTGSSREHAVWAILDYGFEAVVSPRFGDIFRNNSTKNGLVPAQLDEPLVRQLMAAVEADPDLELTVDVERLTVSAPKVGIEAPFPLDPSTQERFLEGLDDIGLSLRHVDEIDTYEAHRPSFKPTVAASRS